MIYIIAVLTILSISLSFAIKIISEKLNNGKKELEDGARRLRIGEMEYNSGLRKFRRHNNRWYSFLIAKELEDGYNKLIDGEIKLKEGRSKIEDGKSKVLFWERVLHHLFAIKHLFNIIISIGLTYVIIQYAISH